MTKLTKRKKRWFTCSMGDRVDLNDPKTYHMYPSDVRQLENKIFIQIGQALWYMDFCPDRKKLFPKRKIKPRRIKFNGRFYDAANAGYYQRQRIYKLIEDFTRGRMENSDNPMWFKEQLFLLEDETDNFC